MTNGVFYSTCHESINIQRGQDTGCSRTIPDSDANMARIPPAYCLALS